MDFSRLNLDSGMVVIDSRTNKALVDVSITQASRIIGVDRTTVNRWRVRRIADKTYKEEYNFFTVYFDTAKVSKLPHNF